MGDKVSLYLNGKLSVSYEEKDPSVARAGKIALQIHAGKPLTVEFKDILIQPLPSPGDGPASGFAWKTASTPGGERRYGLALPPGYDPEKAYPVIMFLHGSGERGEDGVVSSQIGMGSAALAYRSAYQAILVFPQARKTWAAGSDDAKAALAILDEVMKEHRCDTNKVVLTGLSMGGSGTWGIAAENPDRFSCIVTICGTGKPETAGALAKLPTWVLVGDRDREATVLNARTMVRALQAAGGSPRYTEYRGVPHNSWDRAYSDPELIAWMLAQTRGGR
jgi:predicted peptidase